MKSVVKTGKTVDEAIESALQELNASLDDVKIEIIEQSKNGIFGLFGSKPAVVKVELKSSDFKEMLMREINEDEGKNKEEKAIKLEENRTEIKKEKTNKKPVKKAENKQVKAYNKPENPEKSKEEKASKPIKDSSLRDTIDKVETKESRSSLYDLISEEINNESGSEETLKVEDNKALTDRQEKDSSIESMIEEAAKDDNQEKQSITEDEKEAAKTFAINWLKDIVERMHISCEFETEFEADDLYVEFTNISDSDAGIVIGRRAETLNALQYLLGISMNRFLHSRNRVYLDVGGYRERRADNIERLAKRNADKVLKYRKSIKLEPMNAYERRLVHTALQSYKNIETVSEGREPYRKVVIIYKEK